MNKQKSVFFILQFQLLISNSLCRGTARREISPIHQWRLARVGFCCCFRAIPSERKTLYFCKTTRTKRFPVHPASDIEHCNDGVNSVGVDIGFVKVVFFVLCILD